MSVLAAEDPDPEEAAVAVSPGSRFGMVYVLDPSSVDRLAPRVARDLEGVEGIDLVVRREGAEAAVWSMRGELRFAPRR